VLTGDRRIAALNRAYLQRSGPTNVIAFPMQEGPFGTRLAGMLGDVVISLDTAAREAQAAGVALQERLTALLVHGILHLFGFDHEAGGAEARRMQRKQRAILERLGRERGPA
jgi:probable rRNA maturation factor